MARLPQASDLQRTRAPAQTPNVSVRSINYSPATRGAKALASGAQSAIKGVNTLLEARAGQEDHEARKKMLDFKLRVDGAYDEYRRTMPEGAAGFAEGWQKQYGRLAGKFVGKKDANIPESMRDKIGVALKEVEVRYGQSAQDEANKERDRYEVAGLEKSLGALRNQIGVKPDRYGEYSKDGRDLIETSRLMPETKRQLLKKFDREIENEHVLSRFKSAKSIEDFKAIQKDLSGKYEKQPWVNDLDGEGKPSPANAPVDLPDFRGKRGPAAVRFNNPGAQYPGPSATKFGSVGTEIIGGGHKIAVFPTAVHGAAAQFDLLSRKYAGKTLNKLTTVWGGGNSPGAYAKRVARELGISPGTVITKSMLSDPDFAVPLAKAMAGHEAGKSSYPMSDEQWHAAHGMFKSGKPSPVNVKPEGSGLGDEYTGPYSSLSPRERHSLWQRAQAAEKRFVEGARYETKQAMQSDLLLIRTTGEGLPGLDLDHAKTFLEPNQINRHLRQRDAAQYSFRLRDGMPMMKDDEMAARFQDLKPKKDEAYADNIKEYREAMKYAADIRKLRRTDPAAASDEYEGVKKAIEAARSNPTGNRHEQAMTIMRERMTGQALMGIPEAARSPITEADARGLMAPLNGVKGEEIFPVLKKMVPDIVARYGEYSDEVLRFVSRTLYRDKESQETITAIIRNIETTGAVEAAEKERMKQLEEINAREATLSGHRGVAKKPEQEKRSPHPEAVEYLKAHPELAEQFDARYGEGAAAIVLGNAKKSK